MCVFFLFFSLYSKEFGLPKIGMQMNGTNYIEQFARIPIVPSKVQDFAHTIQVDLIIMKHRDLIKWLKTIFCCVTKKNRVCSRGSKFH